MNLGRVRHLVLYELKRLKKLVVVAWLSLALAFVPRLLGAMGLWSHEWYHLTKVMVGTGVTLFGMAGLFIAIWAGLFGIKLVPTRPILRREIFAIRFGVLFGVLIFPVLLLTLISLWLHRFGAGEIGINLGAAALAIVPLWVGVAYFARFAGNLKITIAGLALLGVVIAIADSSRIRGLPEPWTNVVGSWLSSRYIVASWVTTILLSVSFLLVKNQATARRMAVAVLCVIAGWAAIPWAKKRESRVPFLEPLSEPIQWTGVFKRHITSDKTTIEFGFKQLPVTDHRFVIWQFLEGFEYTKGESAKPVPRQEADLHRRADFIGLKFAASRLLKDGDFLVSDQSAREIVVDRQTLQDHSSKVGLSFPKDVDFGEVKTRRGILAGAVCEFEQLVDTPMGTGVQIQQGNVKGEIQWLVPDRRSKAPRAFIEMKFPLMRNDGYDGSWSSPLKNWVFHLDYPKAGVVIAGDLTNTGWDHRIGGVQKRSGNIRFRSPGGPKGEEMLAETPRLKVYRLNLIETGYREVELPELEISKELSQPNYAYSILEGESQLEAPPEEHWKNRPDPTTATRAEVGGWMRTVDRFVRPSDGASREFASLADPWGGLLIDSGKKVSSYLSVRRRSGFVEGADDRWREELVAALGEVEWAPKALVERGWTEAARGKVTELLAAGNQDEEIFKLGVLLKIPEVGSAIVQKLSSTKDFELSDVSRKYVQRSEEWNQALDERLAALDRQTRFHWTDSRSYRGMIIGPWGSLLIQGREKDLEKFLSWARRFCEAGRSVTGGYRIGRVFAFDWNPKELHEAKKLDAKFFQWDSALLQWNLREKGSEK